MSKGYCNNCSTEDVELAVESWETTICHYCEAITESYRSHPDNQSMAKMFNVLEKRLIHLIEEKRV